MPLDSMTILVDHGERRSGLPAQIEQLGLDVAVRRLDAGDIVIGQRIGVERKTVADLHRSISSGRLWRQIGALRASYERLYLIVEGAGLYDGPVAPHGLRGALLAVAGSGVTLLRADDTSECAQWIRAIAVRAEREAYSARRRQPRSVAPYGVLRSVPGLTPRASSGLLRRFGSVGAVAAASDAELLEVTGVGPATVAALRRALC